MNEKKQHIIDIVFVLALFCVFVVLALFIVVLGADVYKKISQNMDENYNTRTSLSYITEKIRQNDVEGGVRIDKVQGFDALVLVENVEDRQYETWIFCGEGDLREITIAAGKEVKPTDGESILSIYNASFDITTSDLIKITLEDDKKNVTSAYAAVNSGEVEVMA